MQVRQTARECLRAALILQHHQLQDDEDTSAQLDFLNHILYTVDHDNSDENSIEKLWHNACQQFISAYKPTSTAYTHYELAKSSVENTLIASANQLRRLKRADIAAKLAAAAAATFTDTHPIQRATANESVIKTKLESIRVGYTASGDVTAYLPRPF